MARLLIHVEGQTEESFVNEVLRAHLIAQGYHSVDARIVGNARLRKRRGGICPWPSVRTEIVNHLKEDLACLATTLVDYYGMPQSGPEAWPGRAAASNVHGVQDKARRVQSGMEADIIAAMGDAFDASRFVPFVVMHEFEGLLFSDCKTLSEALGSIDLEGNLQTIRRGFPTPEDINDSVTTAPSKRLERLLPTYEKPLYGVFAVLEIGLTAIRKECPHFDAWLTELEARVR